MPMAKTLYIIDGHAHIYSAFYAPMRGNLTSPDGKPTKATYIFTTALLGVIEKYKPDMLVVAMDSKAPTFRVDIYPEYKAHRPPMPEDMPGQIKDIEKIVQALKVPLLRIDGYEADDIIGTLAKKGKQQGDEVFICSKDKDMYQLLNDHVKMLDIKKGEVFDKDWLIKEKGVRPDQFIDALALIGDTSDNIPGVPDVGPKTAVDWISKYHSLENLYANADEIKGKRGQSLRDNKENAFLSQKLVTINCESPIDIDYESYKLKEPDKDKLIEIFNGLGFSQLLKSIGAEDHAATAKAKNKARAGDQPTLFDDAPSGSVNNLNNLENSNHDYVLIDTTEKLNDLTTQLKKQKIFAFDTETTAMNPMRAELVGISFSFNAKKAFYVPVKGPNGSNVLKLDDVKKSLEGIFADESIKKVGQNLKYDLIIMRNAGFDVKGIEFDTMVASYCLASDRRSHSMDNMATDYLAYQTMPISDLIGKGKNQKTFDTVPLDAASEYACEDADITWRLYEYLKPRLDKNEQLKKLFYELEMPIVEVLAEMEYNGVSLDVDILENMSKQLTKMLEDEQDSIYELAGEQFNIDSPKQLEPILFDKLKLESKKKGKTGRSTDAGVLEQLKDDHEIIPHILQYRELAKLKNTYVDKLPALVNPKTNRLHASFNQTITVTGRLSSSDPNLQNIPIRTDLGRKIRSAFVPENNDKLILSADYSQIELRLLAHLSGDAELAKAFNNDMDIHAFVASQVYNVAIEEVDSNMRSSAKAVNFGIVYGQGPHGLSRTTGMSYSDAKKFIDDYFKRYGSIRDFMDATIAQAKKTGYAETICGRQRTVQGLSSKNFNIRSQAERLVINTTIQGSAADLIKLAMINIHKNIKQDQMKLKMILQIHDELVFELNKCKLKVYSEFIKSQMENAIQLDVPLKVDIESGLSWLIKE